MYIVGSILVVFGAVDLLDNFGFLPGNFWEFFWPLLIIAFGLMFISRSCSHNCGWRCMWKPCVDCDPHKKNRS